MPTHNFEPLRGSLVSIVVDSKVLAENRLGDPSRREIAVYLPPGYGAAGVDYPLFVDLAGFTGSGLKRLSWVAFGESIPQRIDRLVVEGKLGPVVVAFPDCFTSLGGNQYINSSVMGRWEDYLIDEMIPRLEREFRIRRGRDHRAIFGKSSGGYGALIHGMRHADVWAAIASHSGDVGFDLILRRDLPIALDAVAAHGGDVGTYITRLREARKISGGDFHVLMILAMAASYDPDPTVPFGVRLPVDPETCALDEDAWRRWLTHDPLTIIERPEAQANLRSLRGFFLDCGSRDQYLIHYGTRALVRRLTAYGIAHRYEEFDDNHSGVDYRLDVSLPFLYRALTS